MLPGTQLKSEVNDPKKYIFEAVDNVVQFIKKLIEEENTLQFILYGHSMGAQIALAVASQSPKNIVGLVLETPELGVVETCRLFPNYPLYKLLQIVYRRSEKIAQRILGMIMNVAKYTDQLIL